MNSPDIFQSAPRLSHLTSDPVLQRVFRQIEDDGAVEVVPGFSPRPTPGAAVCVRELEEA